MQLENKREIATIHKFTPKTVFFFTFDVFNALKRNQKAMRKKIQRTFAFTLVNKYPRKMPPIHKY